MIGEFKKILLIGGTGVISSAVVKEAIRNNIDDPWFEKDSIWCHEHYL